ncbi:hypothetical protein ACFXP7_04510 [Microbacterium sp. P06]|uniref:hypothetical protein n=1 Tax=Microbacterium sp. P06 TaxID=3366949 RepID=UPI003746F590
MTRTAHTLFGTTLALLLAVAFVLLAPATARAHGGPFQIVVTPDGAGGVSLYAQYVKDGHLVDEIIDPVVTAKASDGRTAGPVSLVSSSEGVGRWVSESPFLADGDWSVTVRTTTPEVAEATVDFTVAPLEAPVEAGATAAVADTSEASPAMWMGFTGLGAGVLLVGGVVAAVLLRRRTREHVA